MIERILTKEEIHNALTSPLHISTIKVDGPGRVSLDYIGNKATVSLNPVTGKLATAWPTGKRARAKYGGG